MALVNKVSLIYVLQNLVHLLLQQEHLHLGCPFVELGGVGLGSTAPPIVDCTIGETTIEATYLELGDTSRLHCRIYSL